MESSDDMPVVDAEREVFAARITQCYRQLPISLGVNLSIGLLLTGVLWDAVHKTTLVVWLLFLVAVTAARYEVLRAFRETLRCAPLDYAAWKVYFLAGACAAGLVWGAAGVLLFQPDSFTHQVFLAFVLGGMVAGAIPLLSAVDHAFACFAVPVVSSIGVRMLLVGDSVHLTMGLMILIFGFAMLAASAQVGRLFRDANELRYKLSSSMAARQVLQQKLRLDDLTGIANRRMFEEGLAREWGRAQRDGDVLSVISADIDHFKMYNDHYGHPAGDRCLVQVAHAMEAGLYRPGDFVARIGGEEFAFLLPGTALDGARAVAEHIRKRVQELNLEHPGSPVAPQVTISLGIASSDHPGIASAEALLRASDVALYEAKRRGRNQVVAHAA